MSKVLDKLIDSDNRFCKQLRYQKERGNGYHVHLKPEYHVNECHTIWGETVKDILSQLKYVEKTTWDVDALD